MANKYKATEQVTTEGEQVYHLQTGKKGRPRQFVKRGGKYKSLR